MTTRRSRSGSSHYSWKARMDSLKQHYERAIEKLETEVCLSRERAELQRKASASDSGLLRIPREKTRSSSWPWSA